MEWLRGAMETVSFSSGLSVLAIIISIANTWYTWRTRHDTDLVTFEQRKQAVRIMVLEDHISIIELIDRLNSLKQTFDQKIGSEKNPIDAVITKHTELLTSVESLLKTLNRMSSSPSPKARLLLEQTAGSVMELHNNVQRSEKHIDEISQSLLAISTGTRG